MISNSQSLSPSSSSKALKYLPSKRYVPMESLTAHKSFGFLDTILPTSPGLTKPELALRQGIEAAVFITLGASTMMIGDPTWSFDFGRGASFAISQHLTLTRCVKDPLCHMPYCILENLVEANCKIHYMTRFLMSPTRKDPS